MWSSTPVLLVLTVAVLNIVGVVMVLSASSVSSLTDYGSPWYFFLRQLLWTVVGVAVFVEGPHRQGLGELQLQRRHGRGATGAGRGHAHADQSARVA